MSEQTEIDCAGFEAEDLRPEIEGAIEQWCRTTGHGYRHTPYHIEVFATEE